MTAGRRAWARAVKLPDAAGNLQVVDPAAGHAALEVLMKSDDAGNVTVLDFVYATTDPQGNVFYQLASGSQVTDAAGGA